MRIWSSRLGAASVAATADVAMVRIEGCDGAMKAKGVHFQESSRGGKIHENHERRLRMRMLASAPARRWSVC
jgi:hypothetical protein